MNTGTPTQWVTRCWQHVSEGNPLPTQEFPITIYRLVVAAGANRDFYAIHHNSEYAKASGAPEIYANNLFLLDMWERAVREYIGLDGVIRNLGGFRIRIFNTVRDTVVVRGHVLRKWMEDGEGDVEFEIRSENAKGISVGPGRIVATMPPTSSGRRATPA